MLHIFRAHPAIGLLRIDESDANRVPFREDDFGREWTSLPDDVQARELSRFFEGIFAFLIDLCEPTVLAELPLDEDAERLVAAGDVAKRRGKRYVFKLTPEFSELLPELFVVWMRIACDNERPVMELYDGWEGVFLFLDGAAADRLRLRLSADAPSTGDAV